VNAALPGLDAARTQKEYEAGVLKILGFSLFSRLFLLVSERERIQKSAFISIKQRPILNFGPLVNAVRTCTWCRKRRSL
jgi:hypothetical protein